MGSRIVNNSIYYCCDLFSLKELFLLWNYLFIYKRISAVGIFHSTVIEGPTDYLKKRIRENEFLTIFMAWNFKEQMCVYVCVCHVNNV